MPATLASVHERIRERSPLGAAETEQILSVRFDHLPQRLVAALDAWPLGDAAVLDVGSSYGTCLVHFGPGSLGIDNHDESVAFTRAIGLDADVVDIEHPDQIARVPDGAFDYLWVSDVLEHLEAPRLLLRRLSSKLKPGGSLLLQTSVLPRYRAAEQMLRRLGEHPFDAEVHYHQWTIDTVRHLLRRAGYRPARIVPLLPRRLAPVASILPAGAVSRVIVEAVPDAALTERADRAVDRNLRRQSSS
ncbi:MAG TPA: methyltransferase domain-containing protein [Gaiellaceae bacterium]